MADSIDHSLRYLEPADIKAIAVFLRSTASQAQGVTRPSLLLNDDLSQRRIDRGR